MNQLGPFLMAAAMTAVAPPAPVVSSGTIDRFEIGSEHVPGRTITVWLPDSYDGSHPHAVLYMQDGQMLFDASTTWNGQEWGADEIAGRLIREGAVRPFIIVGIPNDGGNRHAEYSPQRPFEAMSEAQEAALYDAIQQSEDQTRHGRPVPELLGEYLRSDAYLRFLVEELKPRIDRSYAVETGPSDTFIMGSSMGGLISLYALVEYPRVFGGAACLSTHWPGFMGPDVNPFPELMQAYLSDRLPPPAQHRIYFDHGTVGLDAAYGQYQEQVDAILEERGYDETRWETRVFEGADHNEDAWRARLGIPLRFLLGRDPGDP